MNTLGNYELRYRHEQLVLEAEKERLVKSATEHPSKPGVLGLLRNPLRLFGALVRE